MYGIQHAKDYSEKHPDECNEGDSDIEEVSSAISLDSLSELSQPVARPVSHKGEIL